MFLVKPVPRFRVLVLLYLYADESLKHGVIYLFGTQLLSMNGRCKGGRKDDVSPLLGNGCLIDDAKNTKKLQQKHIFSPYYVNIYHTSSFFGISRKIIHLQPNCKQIFVILHSEIGRGLSPALPTALRATNPIFIFCRSSHYSHNSSLKVGRLKAIP